MSIEVPSITNEELIALLRDVVADNAARNRQDLLQSAWSPTTSLDDIGFDSLDLVELVFLMEDRFGVELSFNANTSINDVKTIGDLRRELDVLLADRRLA